MCEQRRRFEQLDRAANVSDRIIRAIIWTGTAGFVLMFVFMGLDLSPVIPVVMQGIAAVCLLAVVVIIPVLPWAERRARRLGWPKPVARVPTIDETKHLLALAVHSAGKAAAAFTILGLIGAVLDGWIFYDGQLAALVAVVGMFLIAFAVSFIFMVIYYKPWGRR